MRIYIYIYIYIYTQHICIQTGSRRWRFQEPLTALQTTTGLRTTGTITTAVSNFLLLLLLLLL